MEWINKYLFGAGVPAFLFIAAVFFAIRLSSGNPLLHPIKMLRPLFFGKKSDGVSPIRAVLLALAGTLGVGNIVGVASAVAMGGAGAVFWMWVSAAFAMILKYAEVVLAVSHRRVRNGEYYGGAMYYMKDCFDLRKRKKTGSAFACIFSILCIINAYCMGSVIQSNAISEAFLGICGVPHIYVGIAVAVSASLVFFGKASKIFSITEKVVPFVCLLYFIMSFAVILISFQRIPEIISEIFYGAFSFDSAAGGVIGFFLSRSLRYGTIRGLFSNEAGCGTAPTAHAASHTDSAPEQGYLGILEVFIDTMVLCTMTALVILLNKECIYAYHDNPIMMVFSAFSSSLGWISGPLLCLSIVLFAFATIICWGYYGRECVFYFSDSKNLRNIYFAFYILFLVIGANVSFDAVWGVADFVIGAMTLMNLYVLCRMNGEVKYQTVSYFRIKDLRKRKTSGEIKK